MDIKQCVAIVSDNGESWALNGDGDHASKENDVLPSLINDGWRIVSATAGSGSKDDTSYWLVVLQK